MFQAVFIFFNNHILNCCRKVSWLWQDCHLLDCNQCMSNDHSACIKSTRYLRRTDHCTISTLAWGHHTTKRLSWLPCRTSHNEGFGLMLNLVIAPHGLDSALIWWEQSAWRKARNVFVLLSAGLATNQASKQTPDVCRGKRDTDKRVRCIYECPYNSSGYYQLSW